jgi:hypothetical protein
MIQHTGVTKITQHRIYAAPHLPRVIRRNVWRERQVLPSRSGVIERSRTSEYPNGLASSTGGGVVVSLQRGSRAKSRPPRASGAYHRPKILPVAHTRNPVHATEASAPHVIANTDQMERLASTTSDDCCMTFDSALGPKSVNVVLMTTHTPTRRPMDLPFRLFRYRPPSRTNEKGPPLQS